VNIPKLVGAEYPAGALVKGLHLPADVADDVAMPVLVNYGLDAVSALAV
jgi:hypothetical protein